MEKNIILMLNKTKMTTQEKIDKLIPYIWENFMELEAEYDFHIIIRFHYFLKPWFKVPKEFKDWIDINDVDETERLDIDRLIKEFWEDWVSIINSLGTDDYKIIWKENLYYFFCSSRFDKTGEYQNVDDVDFLLDKVNEFLEYMKVKKT
jgi:hypothetical protein